MPERPVRRLAAATLLGVAAACAGYVAAAPIEPHLDLEVQREMKSPNFEVWGIKAVVRGGEPIDRVRVEVVSGPITIVGADASPPLKAGYTTVFRVQLDGEDRKGAVVRVVQEGRVPRTYDLPLERRR